MDKIWTVDYIRAGAGNSFKTKEEAIAHAKKKTAGDRDMDEYCVFELVGIAKNPVPTNIEFVSV